MLGCCAPYAWWGVSAWDCFIYRHNVCVCVCLCVCSVCITWPCQSIFLCRPFHRQLPAPDPEILWPHPQTAASVSMHTHNTHISLNRSVGELMLTAAESMKYSCFQDSGSSLCLPVFMWTLCLINVCGRGERSRGPSISVTQRHLCLCVSAWKQFVCYLCVHVSICTECAASKHVMFQSNHYQMLWPEEKHHWVFHVKRDRSQRVWHT